MALEHLDGCSFNRVCVAGATGTSLAQTGLGRPHLLYIHFNYLTFKTQPLYSHLCTKLSAKKATAAETPHQESDSPAPGTGDLMGPNRPRCPFYGFHWPGSTDTLTDAGGTECGLDIDHHGSCVMEQEGRTVDYHACPFARKRQGLLNLFNRSIRFRPGVNEPDGVSFEVWLPAVMQTEPMP